MNKNAASKNLSLISFFFYIHKLWHHLLDSKVILCNISSTRNIQIMRIPNEGQRNWELKRSNY